MIQTLDELYENEFGCIEPNITDRFLYSDNNKIIILETEIDDSGTACARDSNCFFRDKREQCPCFSCSSRERDDGYDVKFIDITHKFNENEIAKILARRR